MFPLEGASKNISKNRCGTCLKKINFALKIPGLWTKCSSLSKTFFRSVRSPPELAGPGTQSTLILQIIFETAGPWWLSSLERQSHDSLVMLKVEGSNLAISSSFFSWKWLDKNAQVTQPQFSEKLAIPQVDTWSHMDDIIKKAKYVWETEKQRKRRLNLWPVKVRQEGWHHRLSHWETLKWRHFIHN